MSKSNLYFSGKVTFTPGKYIKNSIYKTDKFTMYFFNACMLSVCNYKNTDDNIKKFKEFFKHPSLYTNLSGYENVSILHELVKSTKCNETLFVNDSISMNISGCVKFNINKDKRDRINYTYSDYKIQTLSNPEIKTLDFEDYVKCGAAKFIEDKRDIPLNSSSNETYVTFAEMTKIKNETNISSTKTERLYLSGKEIFLERHKPHKINDFCHDDILLCSGIISGFKPVGGLMAGELEMLPDMGTHYSVYSVSARADDNQKDAVNDTVLLVSKLGKYDNNLNEDLSLNKLLVINSSPQRQQGMVLIEEEVFSDIFGCYVPNFKGNGQASKEQVLKMFERA